MTTARPFRDFRSVFVSTLAVLLLGVGAPAPVFSDALGRDALRHQFSNSPSFLLPISADASDLISGRCVIWGDMAVMLSPAMTLREMDVFIDGLPALDERRRYRASRFWLKTASDGNVGIPGQRITLTWSFVPDGTLILDPVTDEYQESQLFLRMGAASTLFTIWQDRFRMAFGQIGDLVGIDYVEVEDDGAPQPAPGVVGLRGDVRISMISDSREGVLAFNYLPDPASRIGTLDEGLGGDMVFNANQMSFFNNSQGQHRRLRHVIMHEHGHGLGFLHVDPINFTKLMEAEVGAGLNTLQEDDIRGFQSAYGDWLEDNSSAAKATDLGELPVAPGQSPLLINNLAIERASAQDYFRFQVTAPSVLSVVATPTGMTYLEGPQGGVTTFINSLTMHNLVVDVIDGDGQTIIATLNETGVGEAESGEIPLPNGAGDYFVRVRSASATNQSQRYRLTLSTIPVPGDISESLAVY